ADGYVAQMKGVILSLAPGVQLVDVTHEIKPQDIIGGAFVLSQVVPTFPSGTIHIAVVDPGVGGAREPVIIEMEDHLLVGPNNGLLCLVAPIYRAAYKIVDPRFLRGDVSATFEARDVFAPAAAALACGARPSDAGPEIERLEAIPWHEPSGETGEV